MPRVAGVGLPELRRFDYDEAHRLWRQGVRTDVLAARYGVHLRTMERALLLAQRRDGKHGKSKMGETVTLHVQVPRGVAEALKARAHGTAGRILLAVARDDLWAAVLGDD